MSVMDVPMYSDSELRAACAKAAAAARASEREATRQFAVERKATYLKPCDRPRCDGHLHTHHREPFADLIGGAP